MPVVELFSKRQKRLRGEVPDVYVYDTLPKPLRVQIVHIWSRALGDRSQYDGGLHGMNRVTSVRKVYGAIAQILCQEYGYFRLPGIDQTVNRNDELVGFFLHERVVERALDAVEITFGYIDRFTRSYRYLERRDASQIADDAIEELNHRFKEHGVGYQFVDGQIVRVDSEYLHTEAVKPALGVLRQKRYAGAQQEFLSAHQHYRKGETKEALNDCLNAFESVMKAICDKRRWDYPNNVTASGLIDICLKKELIPAFWQSHYSALRSLLESGVPTARNKQSAHGQGTAPVPVPEHLAAYVLHMTASAIVFLAEAEAQRK